MTKAAADKLFRKTQCKPAEVDVIELHDCFSVNELITYEALGLCPVGKASEFIDSGNNTYGGRHVINPSGGLISKGHPLGATGKLQLPAFDFVLILITILFCDTEKDHQQKTFVAFFLMRGTVMNTLRGRIMQNSLSAKNPSSTSSLI